MNGIPGEKMNSLFSWVVSATNQIVENLISGTSFLTLKTEVFKEQNFAVMKLVLGEKYCYAKPDPQLRAHAQRRK